jgi:hypothetical protein
MTVHQRFGPPAYEFHPELGYLCPSRQLRQNVRVGLAAAAFGLVAGAAATAALLPRHGDLTRSEPALVMPAADPVRDPAPPTASSVSTVSRGAPSSTAERASPGVVKQQPPATPASPAVGVASAARPAAETPAAPVIATDRATAGSGSEPARAATSKRTRTAHSTARRRAREPAPPDAFAASPFSFQTGRFADETRDGRRRDWGGWGGWRW